MEDNQNLLANNRFGIYNMWLNWVAGALAFSIPLLLSTVIDKRVFPLLMLLLCIFLYIVVRHNRTSSRHVCAVLPFIMARSLLISAIIMIVILSMYRKGYLTFFVHDIHLMNPARPYITVLILAPVTALMTGWAMIRKDRLPFCAECLRNNGVDAERGYLGAFYSREGRVQIKLMFGLSLAISAFSWFYYALLYININFNGPDRFNFVVGPCLLMAASIIYLAIRYQGLWYYFKLNYVPAHSNIGRISKLRCLVVCDNEMLLHVPTPDPNTDFMENRIDTPLTLSIRRRNEMPLHLATAYFRDFTNIQEPIDLRLLYTNNVEYADFNIFHYGVILPSKKILEGSRLKGEWFTLNEIVDIVNSHACTPIFAAEMMRLINMTLTWKTYLPDGRRRWPVKKYKPTLQLEEMVKADIDFEDKKWLHVAVHNQDRPFFHLRRFWSKYISQSLR